MANSVKDTGKGVDHGAECIEIADKNQYRIYASTDKFGARVTSDPEEMKLVRKLDLYMMVIPLPIFGL